MMNRGDPLDLIIRDERASDHPAIRAIHIAAFPTAAEADLVEHLRQDGDVGIALVALTGDAVVGHVMGSPMRAPFPALGLGPVAVLPGFRRRGVAERLIRRCLDRAKDEGAVGVFVLGNPAYYGRFGFRASHAAAFGSPYAGPHLMALPLRSDQLPVTAGEIAYAPAFDGLE